MPVGDMHTSERVRDEKEAVGMVTVEVEETTGPRCGAGLYTCGWPGGTDRDQDLTVITPTSEPSVPAP